MSHESNKKTAKDANVNPQALEAEVRTRAYQLYEERGRQDGQDMEDWLQAEKEIAQATVRKMVA